MRDLLSTMRPFQHAASWAVWGAVQPAAPFTAASDLRFPAGATGLGGALHGSSVVVALNPVKTSARGRRGSWESFHGGAGGNDHLLAEAFRDTPVWGGYMVDLHPSMTDPEAANGQPEREVVTAAVALLAYQLVLLGSREPLVVCIGKKADRAIMGNLDVLRGRQGQIDPRVVTIPHYTGANNAMHGGDAARYRELVHDALHEGAACGGTGGHSPGSR